MLIIRNARVIDPKSGTDCVEDVICEEERIIRMAPGAACEFTPGAGDTVMDAKGLVLSPGLIDVHVHFRDPGYTYKEDIFTGAKAAAHGGFTTVVCMANTNPVVDNEETLRRCLEKEARCPIHVLQTATITMGMKGETLTDMPALKALGAVGFTDDGRPIMNSGLVKEAMDEAVRLNVPLSFHEEDPAFIKENGINHGEVSESLGIYGSPALAEVVLVARDCMMALHTGATIDIQHISAADSVRQVRLAKSLGAKVFAEVTPHHFTLDESAVLRHGALAKMNPPLRTVADREEILQGLKDGTIDIIATDHAPHSEEEKALPLTEAPSGITGLETSLALGITTLVKGGVLTLPELIGKMTLNPARLYNMDAGYLAEGGPADLTIFDPDAVWTVTGFASKACNSPFIGETLTGKVKMTVCEGRIVYREE